MPCQILLKVVVRVTEPLFDPLEYTRVLSYQFHVIERDFVIAAMFAIIEFFKLRFVIYSIVDD